VDQLTTVYVSRESQQAYLSDEHSLLPTLSFDTSCWFTTVANTWDCFKQTLKTFLFQWVGVLQLVADDSTSEGVIAKKDYNINIVIVRYMNLYKETAYRW